VTVSDYLQPVVDTSTLQLAEQAMVTTSPTNLTSAYFNRIMSLNLRTLSLSSQPPDAAMFDVGLPMRETRMQLQPQPDARRDTDRHSLLEVHLHLNIKIVLPSDSVAVGDAGVILCYSQLCETRSLTCQCDKFTEHVLYLYLSLIYSSLAYNPCAARAKTLVSTNPCTGS